jgi:hypothetical protein
MRTGLLGQAGAGTCAKAAGALDTNHRAARKPRHMRLLNLGLFGIYGRQITMRFRSTFGKFVDTEREKPGLRCIMGVPRRVISDVLDGRAGGCVAAGGRPSRYGQSRKLCRFLGYDKFTSSRFPVSRPRGSFPVAAKPVVMV